MKESDRESIKMYVDMALLGVKEIANEAYEDERIGQAEALKHVLETIKTVIDEVE